MSDDRPAPPAWLREMRAALGPAAAAPPPPPPIPAPPDDGDDGAWVVDDRPLRARMEAGEPVQVVAFRLGGELHGADVLVVEEAVGRAEVHPLPDVPPRVLGMLRLRGELLPVLDVAPALGLARDASRAPAVLVVATEAGRVAVAADGVEEVVTVPPDALRAAPHAAADRGDGAVLGVARVGGALLTLVDLAEILRETVTPASGEGA